MYSLHPYAPTNSSLTLSASLERNQHNHLSVRYYLQDNQNEVIFSPPNHQPNRADNLWEKTCFELFLGFPGSCRYWELNLSPSGDWNLFRFNTYRHGMVEELLIVSLPMEVIRKNHSLTLHSTLDLNPFIHPHQPIDASITAVIILSDKTPSYWAINHCGNQPDFHLRESFSISLNPKESLFFRGYPG